MQLQQASTSRAETNRLQVRVELQADCFAGIWANQARTKHDFLDPGDVDQALQTASAIGDDRLQKQSQGYVVPDAFTHGTSEQRKRWFLSGFNQGKISACDTIPQARFSGSPILSFPRQQEFRRVTAGSAFVGSESRQVSCCVKV